MREKKKKEKKIHHEKGNCRRNLATGNIMKKSLLNFMLAVVLILNKKLITSHARSVQSYCEDVQESLAYPES